MKKIFKMLFQNNDKRICNPNELSDEDILLYLESGIIYMQHYYNINMPEYFKDIKWYWNKDTAFIKNEKAEIRSSAKKSYEKPIDWLNYCGGRNSGMWILTYNT